MIINGKTDEEREKERPEGLYTPHHTDRWYNRYEKSWVVQLKDKYDNQIGEAVYIHSKQEAINAENRFKEEYGLCRTKEVDTHTNKNTNKIMKCINNHNWENCLTIGKMYKVKPEQWDDEVMYYLNDDNNEPMNTHLNLFEDVDVEYVFKQHKTIEEMLELTKKVGMPNKGIEDKNVVAEMEVGNLAIDLNITFDEEGNRHIDYWIAVKDELGDWVEGNYLIESPILDENLEKNMFETLIQYAKENNYIY